jgi:two-component system, LytTR family, response regulator
MTLRVFIADDEAPARDKLRRHLAAHADIEIAGDTADGLVAAQFIATHKPDVAFLDIQMPGLSGLEVAAQLESDAAPLIVFVTAYDEHAIRAFDLGAVDYLLKPYDRERLDKTLTRLRERRAAAKGPQSAIKVARERTTAERLLVPEGEALKLLDAASIHFLEADDNYVNVHTATKQYLLRRTLNDLLAQLGETRFVRIHKSTAVNLAEVESLAPLFKGDHEVKLKSGKVLRLSRRFKDELFARFRG